MLSRRTEARRVCLSCGNGFDPAAVGGKCAELYGRSICDKCCGDRCVVLR